MAGFARTGNIGRRTVRARAGIAALAVVSLLTACGGGTSGPVSAGSAASIDTSSSVSGQSIVLLLPSYAQVPKALLAQFTASTGIKVTQNSADFDSIHQQLVTSFTAGTNIADVAELDWSWVGQFGRAGWYTPLDTVASSALRADMLNLPTFTYQGKLIGLPYSNDFRIAAYNTTMFTKAGISAPPQTFTELRSDLGKLRSNGVAHPLSISLSATEGTATTWYLLTLAMGGKLFDSALKPVFDQKDSIAAKALQFEVDAVKSGLVNPGAVSNTDTQSDARFLAGNAAYTFSGPDETVAANDKTQSKIVGQSKLALMPGTSAPGPTFGAPEAIGIPANSTHKAAAAAFLKWMTSPSVVTALREKTGLLPARQSVLASLNSAGKLAGGDIILAEAKHVVALFPQGVPTWYSTFSTNAAALINSAAKGQVSVTDALHQLAAHVGS